MLKKLTACLVILALIMPSLLAFAQEPAARNLSVFRVEGEAGAIVEMPLAAGYVFWAHEADVDDAFNIRPLELHAMSLFELQETWNYREFLLEIGTITPAPQAPTPATALTNATVGQIIQFGGFDWRVLEVRGNQVLVLSEYALFERAFHYDWEDDVTWEISDIRRYLNNVFFNRFSLQDRDRIAATIVVNNNNRWFGTPGGSSTSDRIFLLSIEEVVWFFGDSGQLANRPQEGPPDWGYSGMWDMYVMGYAYEIWDEYKEARMARNLQGSAS